MVHTLGLPEPSHNINGDSRQFHARRFPARRPTFFITHDRFPETEYVWKRHAQLRYGPLNPATRRPLVRYNEVHLFQKSPLSWRSILKPNGFLKCHCQRLRSVQHREVRPPYLFRPLDSKVASQPVFAEMSTFKTALTEIYKERPVNKVAGQPQFQLPVVISGILTTGLVDSSASDNLFRVS